MNMLKSWHIIGRKWQQGVLDINMYADNICYVIQSKGQDYHNPLARTYSDGNFDIKIFAQ
jgi:hypothetical protein